MLVCEDGWVEMLDGRVRERGGGEERRKRERGGMVDGMRGEAGGDE